MRSQYKNVECFYTEGQRLLAKARVVVDAKTNTELAASIGYTPQQIDKVNQGANLSKRLQKSLSRFCVAEIGELHTTHTYQAWRSRIFNECAFVDPFVTYKSWEAELRRLAELDKANSHQYQYLVYILLCTANSGDQYKNLLSMINVLEELTDKRLPAYWDMFATSALLSERYTFKSTYDCLNSNSTIDKEKLKRVAQDIVNLHIPIVKKLNKPVFWVNLAEQASVAEDEETLISADNALLSLYGGKQAKNNKNEYRFKAVKILMSDMDGLLFRETCRSKLEVLA